MNINKVLLVIGIAILMYLALNNFIRSKNRIDYLTSLNLRLDGKVLEVDTPQNFNGFGILKVQIINSNIDNYDPRGDLEYYYCIIKDSLAEIYQDDINECNPGDTIYINTADRIFIVKNENKLVSKEIILYENPRFFEYVQKKHWQFLRK